MGPLLTPALAWCCCSRPSSYHPSVCGATGRTIRTLAHIYIGLAGPTHLLHHPTTLPLLKTCRGQQCLHSCPLPAPHCRCSHIPRCPLVVNAGPTPTRGDDLNIKFLLHRILFPLTEVIHKRKYCYKKCPRVYCLGFCLGLLWFGVQHLSF